MLGVIFRRSGPVFVDYLLPFLRSPPRRIRTTPRTDGVLPRLTAEIGAHKACVCSAPLLIALFHCNLPVVWRTTITGITVIAPGNDEGVNRNRRRYLPDLDSGFIFISLIMALTSVDPDCVSQLRSRRKRR